MTPDSTAYVLGNFRNIMKTFENLLNQDIHCQLLQLAT